MFLLRRLNNLIIICSFVFPFFKDLIVDQTIEKVSFCAPDRNFDRAFSYICRDGTTRRWICHCFMAVKDTVSSTWISSWLASVSKAPSGLAQSSTLHLTSTCCYNTWKCLHWSAFIPFIQVIHTLCDPATHRTRWLIAEIHGHKRKVDVFWGGWLLNFIWNFHY